MIESSSWKHMMLMTKGLNYTSIEQQRIALTNRSQTTNSSL